VPLVGAEGYAAAWNGRRATAERYGLSVEVVEHLLRRYGSLTEELLELTRSDPALAAPIPGAPDYLAAEAVYAVTHEGALHLDDILTRRIRLSIESWDRGTESAAAVADLVAPFLGWSAEDVASEVKYYRLRVEAERASQAQDDDLAADAVRLGAPDIRHSLTG
jgi:glycerol-3-phosphate dehydrogenase